MDNDLGGRNPYQVARSIASAASPCPVCGGPSVLSAEVSGGTVSASVTCPACGASSVDVGCDGRGDIAMEVGGRPYYRTAAERDAEGSDDPAKLAEG